MEDLNKDKFINIAYRYKYKYKSIPYYLLILLFSIIGLVILYFSLKVIIYLRLGSHQNNYYSSNNNHNNNRIKEYGYDDYNNYYENNEFNPNNNINRNNRNNQNMNNDHYYSSDTYQYNNNPNFYSENFDNEFKNINNKKIDNYIYGGKNINNNGYIIEKVLNGKCDRNLLADLTRNCLVDKFKNPFLYVNNENERYNLCMNTLSMNTYITRIFKEFINMIKDDICTNPNLANMKATKWFNTPVEKIVYENEENNMKVNKS